MKKLLLNILILFSILLTPLHSAYGQAVKPDKVSTAIYHDVVGPIKDFPVLTAEELAAEEFEEKIERNEELKERKYPYAATALPK